MAIERDEMIQLLQGQWAASDGAVFEIKDDIVRYGKRKSRMVVRGNPQLKAYTISLVPLGIEVGIIEKLTATTLHVRQPVGGNPIDWQKCPLHRFDKQ